MTILEKKRKKLPKNDNSRAYTCDNQIINNEKPITKNLHQIDKKEKEQTYATVQTHSSCMKKIRLLLAHRSL